MCGCFPAAGAIFRSLSNHPPFELEPKGSAGMSPWAIAAATPRPSTATNSRLLGVAGSIIDSLVYSPTTTKKLGGLLLLLLLLLHPDQRRAVVFFERAPPAKIEGAFPKLQSGLALQIAPQKSRIHKLCVDAI